MTKEIKEKIIEILETMADECDIERIADQLLELFEQEIQQAKKETAEEILEKAENLIKTRLDYCRKQNGLPYCKNCGLDFFDIEAIKKYK